MLRSERIERISLYFGREDLKDVMARLGDSSLIQLVDSNTDKKPDELMFAQELKVIEKLEQRMNYFKGDISITTDIDGLEYDSSFAEVREAVDKYYTRLAELRHIQKNHQRMEQVLEENYAMAMEAHRFIHANVPNDSFIINFELVTGVVDRDRKFLVKRTLRQRLRRNVFVKMIDVELSSTDRQKTVMIVYVVGDEAANSVFTIFESVGGRILGGMHGKNAEKDAGLQGSPGVFGDLKTRGSATAGKTWGSTDTNIRALKDDFRKFRKLNKASKRQINAFLMKAGDNYVKWKYYINRERHLLEAMNKLSRQESVECLLGEAWILQEDIGKLSSIKNHTNSKGRFAFEPVKTDETPPTHFGASKFAEAFQGFTNVFGIPKYREINPAIFLIFTFPFMFGAMFGDILHGILLAVLAGAMIFRYESLNRNCGVLQIILEGRFVMLACAFAAIWFGLLYGDFGSLPVALFRSQYEVGRTYPFGIDPVWHHADNKTVFVNSIKMKLSLIIGFAHMSLGSLISIWNAVYFRDRIALLCVAVPQFIIFTLFLGYLVFLCVYKWLVTRNYPSLVNTLIGMYTSPFSIAEPMYAGQLYVQLFIFSAIIVCVPWMFFSKPVYLILKRRIPREGMLDLWITSGIHVVEFGLGLISNTSSYLRLWAVSLAHVQLTSVLHQFTIGNPSWAVAILLFPVYLACTLLLLIGLEGLSACLHALRLNWIEFFSKFYTGGGTKFAPFSFELRYEDIHEDQTT